MTANDSIDASERIETHDVNELIAQADDLRAEVEHYRCIAWSVDEEFRRQNEDRRYTLDDLPYGEELIRTRELPRLLATASRQLQNIAPGNLALPEAVKRFRACEEIVSNARAELDDCIALPSDADVSEHPD